MEKLIYLIIMTTLLSNIVFALSPNTKTEEFSWCTVSGIPAIINKGEVYDVTIQAKYNLNKEDAYNSGNCLNSLLGFDIKLYEDDIAYDDLIDEAIFNPSSFYLTSINCDNGFIEITAEADNIPLADYEDDWSDPEFMGYIVRHLSSWPDESCTTNLVSTEIGPGCEDSPCCDLSTHLPKPAGLQPTGYIDNTDGFCYGSNSPIGTNYVKTRDYYCNGVDADVHYTDTTFDTCGTCENCINNDLTCNYYTSGTSCGNGGELCDGVGNCVCLENHYYKCYGADVYWYDSCDIRGEKKQECGEEGCNLVTDECNTCTPQTCSNLGKECGEWDDGCGETLNCGTCSGEGECIDGVCIIVGEAILTRVTPTIVESEGTFEVIYQTINVPSESWFVAWEDTITGGCTPTIYQSFMAGTTPDNDQKTITFTAPTSGSCTFTGYYQFTDEAQTNFPDTIVAIGTCNTDADTNCDSLVSFSELSLYANKWVDNLVSFSELIEAANAWVNS